MIGKTSGFIANIETGRSGISDETVIRICNGFSISEEWLRTGNGEMFTAQVDAADKAGIGERVKVVRKESGLTQEEFGRRIGFSKKQVFNVEKGVSIPSIEFLHKVEQMFSSSYEWLVKGTGEIDELIQSH